MYLFILVCTCTIMVCTGIELVEPVFASFLYQVQYQVHTSTYIVHASRYWYEHHILGLGTFALGISYRLLFCSDVAGTYLSQSSLIDHCPD
jgi:hypothetical protein